eukprot:159820-Chlamydomonas_euryale.AAC.15
MESNGLSVAWIHVSLGRLTIGCCLLCPHQELAMKLRTEGKDYKPQKYKRKMYVAEGAGKARSEKKKAKGANKRIVRVRGELAASGGFRAAGGGGESVEGIAQQMQGVPRPSCPIVSPWATFWRCTLQSVTL